MSTKWLKFGVWRVNVNCSWNELTCKIRSIKEECEVCWDRDKDACINKL